MTDVADLKLPKGVKLVLHPDHPFTFDGPDFLLYDENGMLAVFTVRKSETIRSKKLLARITNAMLAYPPQTQMILLAGKELNNSLPGNLEHRYFSQVIEANDLKKVKSLLKDKKTINQIRTIQKYQHITFQNQAFIQNNNQTYLKRTSFDKKDLSSFTEMPKAILYDPLKQKTIKARAGIYQHGDEVIGFKNLRKNISDIVELRPFYEYTINADFDVTDGVAYGKVASKVLNLSEKPTARFDPLKPMRLASLFGWYLVNTDNIAVIESRIPKSKRK